MSKQKSEHQWKDISHQQRGPACKLKTESADWNQSNDPLQLLMGRKISVSTTGKPEGMVSNKVFLHSLG